MGARSSEQRLVREVSIVLAGLLDVLRREVKVERGNTTDADLNPQDGERRAEEAP